MILTFNFLHFISPFNGNKFNTFIFLKNNNYYYCPIKKSIALFSIKSIII